eukprot:TRINITY_DN4432_c2_g1_i1.p1 TRINITY_DN4432_c2_g1~~TRINITY_DN4432_c2_g1_i1.p1  ORF type:complete len:392 (+),score=140.99 TRINITY_DN4432_c2_g1_i1:48-1178(+)
MSGMINARKKEEKEEGVVFMRMKRAGKRFEIAVYKDLIPAKRTKDVVAGLDLSKVLQVEKIFSNAAKGDIHKPADLQKAFSDVPGRELKTDSDILRFIIETGDLQVDDASRKESAKASTGALKELATLVNNKVFKPEEQSEGKKKKKSGTTTVTKWTDDDIERELKNCRFHASDKDMTKNVVNAIKAIALGGTIPIERKQQRYQFNADDDTMDALEEFCTANEGFAFIAKETDDTMDIVFDPLEKWVEEGLKKISDDFKEVPHDKLDGDLTEKGTKVVAVEPKKEKGGKKKGKEEKKKGKGRNAADDDSEEEAPTTTAKPKKGKAKGKAPAGGGGGDDEGGKDLKAMLASLGMDDDDDDNDTGKGKGKGKKKKGKR